MHDEQVSLLIQEPGEERARLVVVSHWPFTLGDSPSADVIVRRCSTPLRLCIDREQDRYIARNLASGGRSDPGPGFPLKHGTRIRAGGIRVQFLTHLPAADEEMPAAASASREKASDGSLSIDPARLNGLAERVRRYLDRVDQLRERLNEPPEFLRRP